MSAHEGILRQVRSEVIPQVPELAPHLERDPEIIQTTLSAAIEKRGVDPAIVEPHNMNKLERHVIAGFAIGKQREFLVEGEGAEAQFRSFERTLLSHLGLRSADRFQADIIKNLDRGAKHVEETYGDWWLDAAVRYHELGYVMATEASDARSVPLEGQDLFAGLRTRALGSSVVLLARTVNQHLDGVPADYKLRACHDTSYLVSSKASLHFTDFALTEGIDGLRGSIGRHGRAGSMTFKRGSKSNWDSVFRRSKQHESVTLKCPAHAANSDPDVDTNLVQLTHASINQAPNYNLLKP